MLLLISSSGTTSGLARTGLAAMSAVRSLTGVGRTSRKLPGDFRQLLTGTDFRGALLDQVVPLKDGWCRWGSIV